MSLGDKFLALERFETGDTVELGALDLFMGRRVVAGVYDPDDLRIGLRDPK